MVLDLLYNDRWEWSIERKLNLPNNYRRGEPYVRVYRTEYSVDDYLVACGIGEKLLAQYLVEGKKHWGWTDNHELSISDWGRDKMRKIYEDAGVPYNEQFSRRLRTERWFRESNA